MTSYAYRHGVSSATVPAESAYTELERIRHAHEERLSPRDIVDESRPQKAVLHPFFEWNNDVAAEEYRVQQARRLSRSVYVVTAATEEAPQSERPVYFHVEANNYQPGEVLLRDEDKFASAVEALQRRLSMAERAVREVEELGKLSDNHERLAAIGLAVQGFEAVRAAVALIR